MAVFSWFVLVGAAVAARPEPERACPLVGETTSVALMDDRVRVEVATEGTTLHSGLDMQTNPHGVRPAAPWREFLRWVVNDEQVALLFARDLLLRVGPDLADAAKEASKSAFNKEFPRGAKVAPLVMRAQGHEGTVVYGPALGDGWGATAVIAAPDGTLLEVDVFLPKATATPDCRSSTLDVLTTVAMGSRSPDRRGDIEVDLVTGGRIVVHVPDGFTLRVHVGWEHTVFEAVSWVASGDEASREGIEFIASIVPWDKPPRVKPADVIARGRILGSPTSWYADPGQPGAELAAVPGQFGKKRDGVIYARVVAATPERRAQLRVLAERSTLVSAKPDDPEAGGAEPGE